ncbi:hypothetical protein DID77_02130 [Candidatus Marinamargulisbacteria bacterium SCGC AG-439-L15]|nr:hypothetical protein DID77_02130 [Candidatus Marinamargulisbacteria bacterium SCGC AG-439-L15]
MKNFLLRDSSFDINNFHFKNLRFVISIREILVFILHLVLIFYVIDLRLPLSFRIADILLLSIFMGLVVTKTTLFFDRKIVQPYLLWWLFFVLGSVFGVLKFGFNFQYSILYYKYFLIFCIPIVYLSLVNSQKIFNTQMKLWCFSFIFLLFWPFIRLFLILSNQLQAGLRPDFPFSTSLLKHGVGAGHLYSVLIGFGVLFFLMYKIFSKKKNVFLFFFLFFVVASIVLIMTGSRGGIFGVVTILFFLSIIYPKYFFSFRVLKRFFVVIITLIPFIVWKTMSLSIWENDGFKQLVLRSFRFNFFQDSSSFGRIAKLFQSLEFIQSNGFFIGNGPFVPQFWFDGLIANIISSSGFIGLILFALGAYNFNKRALYYGLKNDRYREYVVFKWLIYYYVLTNIVVTEFILVTRSVVPCLSLLMLLYIAIKNDYDIFPEKK